MLNVRAVLIPVLSAALLVVGVSSCRKNRPPDVPAVPTGSSVCFKDTTYTFTTTATDPDGDSVAVRFIGVDLPSGWSGWFPSGDTVALTHAWSDTGTYQFCAQAQDRKGSSSGWSSALTVQVVYRWPPQTPAAPTGPDIGGRDSSYTFATAAFHPDSINVAIRFSWGDGDTSNWSPFVASGESVRMSHAWATPDVHQVTAQAKDTGNVLSQWSSPHDITIRPPDTLRKWRFQLKADSEGIHLYSSPAIGPDGTIYVGSSDSALYAVNPDGTLKWRYLTGGDVRSSPAIGSDGTVYFGSEDSYLYALNPDGTLKWSYLTAGDIGSSPAVAADGTIYVGSNDNRLHAVNSDGTLKWSYLTGSLVSSSPAIAADGTVYFGSYDDFLYALNPDSTLKWRYDVNGNAQSSPAIAADGTVYVGLEDRKFPSLYALNPDGTLKWQYETGGRVRSSTAIGHDGTVYVGSESKLYGFQALNPDGTIKWRYGTGKYVQSSPAIANDGTVYFGSDDNYLYALNPDSTLKWRYETGANIESSPTIGPDGTVYFTSDDGYLYALKGTSPLADSPWPKFHHDLRNTGRVGGGR
jgi:outer membrane protein assembly factor BamB